MAYNGWDYSVSGGYTGTIPFSGGVTKYLYITTVDDYEYENTESVAITLDIDGDPYSQATFEGDIYDNDATTNQNVPFGVSADSYPRKKTQRPPGPPNFKSPTQQQLQAATRLRPLTIQLQ